VVSVQFDPDVAHPARVYNVWLGGKNHFAADRLAAQQVTRCRPQVVAGARANRAFLACVVRYLAADLAPEQVSSGVAAHNRLVPAGITARKPLTCTPDWP
jgi:hypothetical protein